MLSVCQSVWMLTRVTQIITTAQTKSNGNQVTTQKSKLDNVAINDALPLKAAQRNGIAN